MTSTPPDVPASAPEALLPPPRPKKLLRSVLVFGSMMLAGGFSGFFGMRLGASVLRDFDGLRLQWTDVLLLFALLFVVILVHEIGHVVGGLAGGMRFLMLTVGPFRLHRAGEKLTMALNTSINLGGGLAVMLPQHTDNMPRRLALMIAGGPLASVLLSAAGAALFVSGGGRLSLAGLVLGIASAGIFFVTIMPMSAGGFTSDGGQLLALRRTDPGAELNGVLQMIAASSLGGTRPREYDAALMTHALAMEAPRQTQLMAAMLGALWQLDRGERPDAHMQRIMQHFEELLEGERPGFALWVAWYHAAVRHDHATAAAWAKEAEGGLVEPMQRDMLAAAMALAAGDATAAIAAADRGAARAPGIDPGGEQLVRDLLAQTRAAAAEAAARSAA